MRKNKNTYLTVAIAVLVLTGLYINFILQKDFLIQLGFDGMLAIVCILFFDASKIISEILFFKLKKITPKLIVRTFAVVLIFLSVYATFSVRTWKSRSNFQSLENANALLNNKNKEIKATKNRLTNQLESLEDQIKMKRTMILSFSDQNQNKWITFRYNKEINKLSEQKTALLKKIDDVVTKKVLATNQKLSLQQAMEESIGTGSEKLEIITNLVIALVTDGIILFLCFSLSFVLPEEEEAKLKEVHSLEEKDKLEIELPKQQEISYKLTSIDENEFHIDSNENILFYDDSKKKSKRSKKKTLSS